ncbi:hypothetical protein [Alkalicoccobacillus gibsonii]|nr:hypothetical protein [Alkalicoccobacillus gibsonii]
MTILLISISTGVSHHVHAADNKSVRDVSITGKVDTGREKP